MRKSRTEQLDLTADAIDRQSAELPAVLESDAGGTYGLIMQAVADPNCDPAKLREMLAVKQDWDADESRKAFAIDLVLFQGRCPIIERADKGDKAPFAKLDRIWRETRQLRAECGLSIAWTVCEIDANITTCHLEGMLVHRSGHVVPIRRTMPVPEAILSSSTGKSVQNATQRAGSAESYCKRYAACAMLGIVTGTDDDGEGGAPPPDQMISARDADEISGLLRDAPPNIVDWFWKKAEVGSLAELSAARGGKALTLLKAQIRKGGAS
jgi:hypothetical protein